MNTWVKGLLTLTLFLMNPLIEARTLLFTYTSPEPDNFFPDTYHNTQIEFKVERASGESTNAFATMANQLLTLTINDNGPDLLNPYTVIIYIQTIKPRGPPLPSFLNTPSVGSAFVQEDGGDKNRLITVIDPTNLDAPGPLAIALFIF